MNIRNMFLERQANRTPSLLLLHILALLAQICLRSCAASSSASRSFDVHIFNSYSNVPFKGKHRQIYCRYAWCFIVHICIIQYKQRWKCSQLQYNPVHWWSDCRMVTIHLQEFVRQRRNCQVCKSTLSVLGIYLMRSRRSKNQEETGEEKNEDQEQWKEEELEK